MHRVVAVALPEVVAFDLTIPAQVFGHRDERERYSFTVAAEQAGPVPSTTGFAVHAPHGLEALARWTHADRGEVSPKGSTRA